MSFKPMVNKNVGEVAETFPQNNQNLHAVSNHDVNFIELKESKLIAIAAATGGWLLRATLALALGGGLIGGFLVLERQPAISQTFGLTDLRLRMQAFPDAMYWSYRKWANTKAESYSPIATRYGYARDFNAGQLLVHEYTKTGRVEKSYPLASIEIYNHQHAAMRQWVRERSGAETRFDIYTNAKGLEHVVVWAGSGPWNVQFISQGFAYPSPNPPTNVVDAAFAEYYWNRVKGKTLDAVEIINKP